MRGMNLTGQKFGRLLVREYSHSNNGKFWICDCSCGCLNREMASRLGKKEGPKRRVHGLNGTPLKDCYSNMISRCYDEKNNRYDRYGGRGISVCDEWRENRREFYRWAVDSGFKKGLTIERRDIDGDYSPDNCTWVTHKAQQSNTSRSLFFHINGEKLHLAEICRRENVSYMMVYKRIKKGWDIRDALDAPSRFAQ